MKNILFGFIVIISGFQFSCSSNNEQVVSKDEITHAYDTISKNDPDLKVLINNIVDSLLPYYPELKSKSYYCFSFIGMGNYPKSWKDSLQRFETAEAEQFHFLDTVANDMKDKINFFICFIGTDTIKEMDKKIHLQKSNNIIVLDNMRNLWQSLHKAQKNNIPRIPSIYFADLEGNILYNNNFPSGNPKLFKDFLKFAATIPK